MMRLPYEKTRGAIRCPRCPRCSGKGYIIGRIGYGAKKQTCTTCEGAGLQWPKTLDKS